MAKKYLMKNQAVDITVADNPEFALVGDKFSVEAFSPSGAWGGGTVNVYAMSATEGPNQTPLLLESLTEDSIRVGLLGSIPHKIKAELVGSSGADITVIVGS